VTKDRNKTLGQILKARRDLFPPPLDTAVEKLWGFASEEIRHVNEGATVEFAEVELVVNVACAAASYLTRKAEEGSG
jgi:hypothetical protein